MTTRIKANWIKEQQFEAEHEGNRINVDGNKQHGHGPKALLLTGLAGCSGIDVTDILKKMRVEFSDFSIDVESDQTEEHPRVFKDITITFRMKIASEHEDKLRKAVELSLEKYCGVSAMLKKNSAIHYKLVILK